MKQSRSGLLLVVSGPAGVGKGTIDAALLDRHDDIRMSVSATTRSPRPGEIDGVHYFFKTEDEFRRMIDENAFLEYMYVFPGKVPVDSNNVRLRMTISGTDVIAEFCVEGEGSFRRVYEGRLDAQNTDEVGLQCNGGPSDAEHWVLFRNFTVTRTDD